MKYQHDPTTKQLTALKLMQQGNTASQAMRKAGYSESSIRNPKQNLFNKPAVIRLIDTFKMELHNQGLTTAYLVAKTKQFLNAQDYAGNPDYKTQIAGYDRVVDLLGLKEKSTKETPSRRITLEEFIQSDNDNTVVSEADKLTS